MSGVDSRLAEFLAKCRLKKEPFKSVQDFFNKFLLAKNRAA